MKWNRKPLLGAGVLAVGAALIVATATSCAWVNNRRAVRVVMPTTDVQPPWGAIYTEYSAPLDHDLGDDGQATPVDGLRTGQSSSKFFHLPFPVAGLSFGWGDASVEKAANNAGIQEVKYADYDHFQVLSIWAETQVNVYGQ